MRLVSILAKHLRKEVKVPMYRDKDFVFIEKEEIDEYFGKMKELIKIVDALIEERL